jgi:superfamily II DNA/RNA helicase
MNKMERAAELAAFRRGDFRALLVSDLAARGIDVPEVDAVFNLELPTDETHYVHRAGRTGRMGAEGLVLTIVEPREAHVMPRIARRLGVDIRAADLQKGRLVPDRGDKPGVARQAREDGDERDAGRRGDRGGREEEPRPRGDRPSRGGRGGGARGARGEGRGAGGRGGRGGGGRGAASGGGHYTPKGQPRRRTRNASSA